MIIVIFFLFLHLLNCNLNLGPVKCSKKPSKVNRLLWIANLVNWTLTQNRFSIIMQVVKEILMLWLVQDYVNFAWSPCKRWLGGALNFEMAALHFISVTEKVINTIVENSVPKIGAIYFSKAGCEFLFITVNSINLLNSFFFLSKLKVAAHFNTSKETICLEQNGF